MKSFLTALTLLTIVPIPARWSAATSALGKSLAWFPVVGIGLGLVLTGALYLSHVLFSDLVAAALVVALWAILTGALHLEGVADAGDGLAAAVSRERRLEIMHDPRVGAFGVVAVVILLLMKFAAVSGLRREVFLVLSTTLARWAMVFAAAFPLARAEGMAARFRDGFGRRELLIATAVTFVTAGAFGWRGAVAWIAAMTVVLIFASLAQNRLGGMSGDIYGTIGEVVEVVVLMIAQVRM